jgi:hypothetical protein
LPPARQLIQLHGGRLTLESKPNAGTTVTAFIPRERLIGNLAESTNPFDRLTG